MSGPRLSVKAIIVKDGRVLVIQCRDRDDVWYTLPGGGQQVGETVEQALRRECREELGCEIRMGRLRFVRDYIASNHEFADIERPGTHQVELMFECTLESEPTKGTFPDSAQEGIAWLDVSSLLGCRLYPRVLERMLSQKTDEVLYLGDIN